MAKRISAIQESIINKETSSSKLITAGGFIGNISGLWSICSSSTPCKIISAQKYKLNIDYPFSPSRPKGGQTTGGSSVLDTPAEKGYGGGGLSLPMRIAGSGRTSSASVTVSGTQLGTRLKFLEKWSSSSHCIVDVRLSLCGSFFSGVYTDIKSGKSGDVEGFRVSLQKNSVSILKSILSKSALLCTMACGRLSSSLINLSLASPPISTSTVDGEGCYDMGESPHIKRRASSVGSEGGEGDLALEEELEAASEEIANANLLKWIKSDLLSGGLPMDGHLIDYLNNEIKIFTSLNHTDASNLSSALDLSISSSSNPFEAERSFDKRFLSIAEIGEENEEHSCRGLLAWWLSRVFFSLSIVPLNQNPKGWNEKLKMMESDVSTPEVVTVDSFLSDLRVYTGAGRAVDEYITHHVGQSGLSKVGGEHMRGARRSVLAALVKHSGCAPLCIAEYEGLSSGSKLDTERPNSLLIDLWRSAQKCVEHAIRSKKGSSFEVVAVMLGRKADFLLDILPNAVCLGVQEVLSETAAEILHHQQQIQLCPNLITHDVRSEVPSEALEDCSKIMSVATEFLMSAMKDTCVAELRNLILQGSFHALTRTAAMKAYMLLFNKIEASETPLSLQKLPPLSSIGMQPAAVEFLFLAFRDITDEVYTHIPRKKDIPPSSEIQGTGTLPSPVDNVGGSNVGLSGHYSDGLYGVNIDLMGELKKSFENMFEFITQLLSRCTWAGDRDGQCISLACWGLKIKPDDHVFLNRTTGIFRVLQTVLDDARTSMAVVSSEKPRSPPSGSGISANTFSFKNPSPAAPGSSLSTGPGAVFTMSLQEHRQGPYGVEMTEGTLNRLAQLVLKVVHSLASQVALCKEGPAIPSIGVTSRAPRLQRMPSGPDTLSQSLFDMLYAELFTGLKTIIVQTMESTLKVASRSPSPMPVDARSPSPGPSGPASSTTKSADKQEGEDLLEGEQYIYRILRLLYHISNSKVCRRSLSSPKWLTLLLFSFGCGGFSTQRRILRLLRRLLMNMDPADFRAVVPCLYGHREEITLSAGPLDEDDVKTLMQV